MANHILEHAAKVDPPSPMKWVPLGTTYLLTTAGEKSQHGPDAIIVPKSLPTRSEEMIKEIRWTDPLLPVKFKIQSDSASCEPEGVEIVQKELIKDELQLASYALEMLSALGNRLFVLGLLFDGYWGRIWYFSRSVVISSTSFHIESQFTTFASIIAALPRLSFEQLGFDPNIFSLTPPTCPPRSLTGWILRLPKENPSGAYSYASIRRIIHIQRCIIGRATVVGQIEAFFEKIEDIKKGEDSGKGEDNEKDERAKRLYRRSLQPHDSPSVKKSPAPALDTNKPITFENGTEEECYRLLRATEEKYKDSWVFKLSSQVTTRRSELHILEKARSAGIDRVPAFRSSMSGVLARLSDGSLDALNLIDSSGGPLYEHRDLRVLVSEYIHHVYRLWGVELKKALHDVIYVIRDLDKAKMLHRDISINNLAYRRDPHGRVEGIIYDFDLALDMEADTASSKHRTGTTAFLAIHLLRNTIPPHRLSFDYESILYVIWWLVTYHMRGGATITEDPMEEWYLGSVKTIRGAKWDALSGRISILPHHKDLYEGLRRLRKHVRNALNRMIDECDTPALGRHTGEFTIDYELLSRRGVTAESLGLTADGFSAALGWRDEVERYERGEIGTQG
ncbi:hypothetical protein BOTBODRAFT_29056 [Botryobasidium botryosum FD-172 SS1]|uniref:Protein kinase domain-containing protein n=1 Tax=Botryobasidium botryosum (strain FD-172 SS1) TaxID=930990 RepID=A0A067N4H0_BOTB1|nr:hypothetical protein BOTBODRAFT_29056 [Botryobasidium botryosum FD-172 SS1]